VRKEEKAHIQRRPCKMEAKTGTMQSQAKECPEPPEAGNDKTGAFSRGLQHVSPCQDLNFRLLPSRPTREFISVGLRHWVCGSFVTAVSEN
jgi:hypothetical protein